MAIRERPINRQLAAYEEGWKRDHADAMRFWDFQEILVVGIGIFRALLQIDVTRRHRVARGLEEFSTEEDEAMRECFRWWLRPCEKAIARLRYYEDRFAEVEGAAEFRRCCEEAQEIVAEWRPAGPVRTPEPAPEAILPHTGTARSAAELAAALDRVSTPTGKDSVPLGFNPDDYPLF